MEKLFDKFNELFEGNLSHKSSRLESFERAQKEFERSYGWSGYKTYESFKVSRSRRRRK